MECSSCFLPICKAFAKEGSIPFHTGWNFSSWSALIQRWLKASYRGATTGNIHATLLWKTLVPLTLWKAECLSWVELVWKFHVSNQPRSTSVIHMGMHIHMEHSYKCIRPMYISIRTYIASRLSLEPIQITEDAAAWCWSVVPWRFSILLQQSPGLLDPFRHPC